MVDLNKDDWMKIRPAKYDELSIDHQFIYYKNHNDKTDVTLRGFVRSFKSPIEEGDGRYDTIYVVQKEDGEIILAVENQLFIRVY